MRSALGAAMLAAPSRTHSPYFSRRSFSFALVPRAAATALAAVLIVVLVGGGTVYASQGSLPGDLLYSVKINVAEPVEVALAPTPAAKAQVHVALAGERLQEAQALAAEGKLTASTTQELAANFDAQTQAATALTQSVAAQDPGAAAQLTTELSSSVAANSAVLATIGTSAATTTLDDISPAALASASSTALASTIPATAADATSTTLATSSTATVAAALEARATQELQAAQGEWVSLQASADATTSAQVAARVSDINTLVSDGSAALGYRTYPAAIADFTEALQDAVVLKTFLTAGQASPKLLAPLLNRATDDASSTSTSTPEYHFHGIK